MIDGLSNRQGFLTAASEDRLLILFSYIIFEAVAEQRGHISGEL